MAGRLIRLSLFLFALAGFGQGAWGQQQPGDHGVLDTVDLVFSVIPDATTNQLKLKADLYFFNDSSVYSVASLGFAWDNPNLQMDSATAAPFVVSGFDGGLFFYENASLATTNANKRFVFGGFRITGTGVGPNPARQRWASYYFTLSNWNVNDSICMDTLTYSGASAYAFAEITGDLILPYYEGPECVHDTAYVPPSALVLTPDSLHFSGIAGAASPPTQMFQVASDNINFPFSIAESISWLVVSPLIGTTPRTINAAPNTTGLPAGNYKDSIMVSSGTATNSPQWVVVTMTLIPPPPIINATPSSFTFNSIANDTNPSPKTLIIKNTGSSTLNWTATWTQPWLDVSPNSGVDSTNVAVSVDITGLGSGTYYDTIVISDPAASNNPVKRPVTLNIGSDLPLIVAPPVIYIVTPNDSTAIGPRTFHISNGGIGSMTYSLSESSPRILTMTPSSGSAPDSVTVTFKKNAGTSPNNYMDTVWITSPEATNSPYPVVFFLHYVNIPALLGTSVDTVTLTVYECSQGAGNLLASSTISVLNQGLDFPQSFSLSYESNLFTTNINSGTLPSFLTISALDPGLPLGTYYDTLWVIANLALRSPKPVIIKYVKSPGVIQPLITLNTVDLTIPTQENEGPVFAATMTIQNKYGGCMPWHLTESIPWLTPVTLSGEVPGTSGLLVNAGSYVFGQYPDSFWISAPTASNDSLKVRIKMVVWKFFGDVDYNKRINILDVIYLVQYLFNSGPQPIPERRVGDLNCDRFLNILDVTYLVSYLFAAGPIPCGNPFK